MKNKTNIKGHPIGKSTSIKNRKELLDKYLDKNLTNYLEEPIAMGFTDRFPEDPNSVIDEIEIKTTCRNFPVKFKVRYGKVIFGDKKKYSCHAITTDRAEIDKSKMLLGGFGANAHLDEAKVMEEAIAQMARKHSVMVCTKSCSWPFAKAIVGEVTDDHLRSLKMNK